MGKKPQFVPFGELEIPSPETGNQGASYLAADQAEVIRAWHITTAPKEAPEPRDIKHLSAAHIV